MASREFRASILNNWKSPLECKSFHEVDAGEWQEPWQPNNPAGAGIINPDETKEWRSESNGFMTGTSGWARWGAVVDVIEERTHTEWVQVNWSVPFVGTPSASCGVFRDPEDNNSNPPILEIVPVLIDRETGEPRWISQDGSEPALAQAVVIAPYVLAAPWLFPVSSSWVTHPRYAFFVRRRSPPPPPRTFGASVPSPQVEAMEAFRVRAKAAWARGYVGGFPNFYEAMRGQEIVGGTVFAKSPTAEWRDVPIADLGRPPLENFGERMRASNAYASAAGFVGAFPTFYHADNIPFLDAGTGRRGYRSVCGTVLIKPNGAEWRDIPLGELGNPDLEDFGARFRGTQDYAIRNGFVGGFPTMFDATKTTLDGATGRKKRTKVCGTVLLRPDHAKWEDVVLSSLPH